LELAVHKVTFIEAAIFPFERTSALLFTFEKIPNVRGACFAWYTPCFNALTMLQVINPVPFKLGLIIYIDEYSKAIGPVIEPLAIIHVSVGVRHPASPIGQAPCPHAFVF
jgi:hypothetical protein